MSEAIDAVLNAVSAPIFLCQQDQILFANRAAAALLGFSQAETVGLPLEAVFATATDSLSGVAALNTPAGKLPVTLANETIEYAGTQVRLVTALRREQAENALPSSDLLFEAIFESTVVGIAIMDERGNYVRVNRTYAEIYGYAPEEMIGRHVFLVFQPEFHARVQETHDRFIRGEGTGVRSDWTVVRKDGQKLEISAFNNRLITASGERFRIVAVIDITEQKRTQQALEVSEQRLNSILNSMRDAVWSLWANTHQLYYVNPAIEILTGYTVEEAMTQNGLLLEIVHPEDRAHYLEQMHSVLSGNRIDIDHRIIRRDGVVRWVHQRFWAVRSPDGDRIGGLMSDITDRRLAVEQALQLKLEAERVRLLSSFIRDASHEFRTPLAIINTRLELMERNPDPQQRPEYIKGIREQTQRILKLVDSLITISRLDELRELVLEPLDLGQLLTTQREPLEQLAQHKAIAVKVEAAPDEMVVQGELHELLKALQMIFENAVSFTPEGGQIELRCVVPSEDEIALEVVDNGIGISPADQERIFERFYRVDRAHSTEGFGLGLPIARRITELHHGRIEVESVLGQGSRFRLVFPAFRPA